MGSPTLDGYTFTGWKITVGESGKEEAIPQDAIGSFIKDPNNTFTISAEFIKTYIDDKNLTAETVTIKFTATWEATEYTITYQVNEADDDDDHCTLSGGDENYTIESDTITLPTITPDKGYETENKWYFDEACTGEAIDSVNGKALFEKSHGANITLYAQVTAIQYSVRYDLGDFTSGTAPTDSYKYTVDGTNGGKAEITVAEAPDRVGYEFRGWKIGDDEKLYSPEGDNKTVVLSEIIDYLASLSDDKTIVLIAQWKQKVKLISELVYNYNDYPNGVDKTVIQEKIIVVTVLDNQPIDNNNYNINPSFGISEDGKNNIEKITIGGTYLLIGVTLTLKDTDNYVLVDNGIDNEELASGYSIIVKYQTVQIGSGKESKQNHSTTRSFISDGNWYTIEEALTQAKSGQTVRVVGSNSIDYASNNSIVTSFTVLPDTITEYSEAGRTVASGVILFLPYDGSTGVYNELDTTNGHVLNNSNYRNLELKVPAKINIINNGTITIGGETTGNQNGTNGVGHTAGRYAQITLGAEATIKSDGDINSWGFIIEEEQNNKSAVTMSKGKLYIPLWIREHRGGSITNAMAGSPKGSPFNRYYIENITSKLKIEYNAIVYGRVYLFINTGSIHAVTDVNFVGNSKDYFFQLYENSYVEWKYCISDTNIEGLDLSAHMMKVDIYGDASVNSISITSQGKNISTKNAAMPIPWNLYVTFHPYANGSNATVNSMEQDIKILPGGTIKIAQGVILNIRQLIVHDSTFTAPDVGSVAYSNENSKQANGRLIVNGIVNAQNLGGYVETEVSGAQLNVDNSTATSYELSSTIGELLWVEVQYRTDTKLLTGDIYSSTGNLKNQQISAGNYTSKNNAWITDESRFPVRYKFYSRDKKDGVLSVFENDNISINNPEYYTHLGFDLVAAAVTGYEFVGWYSSPECTGDQVENIDKWKSSNDTITLYGLFEKWAEGTVGYELTLNANGDNALVNGASIAKESIISTKLDEYNLPTPTREGYDFLGWTKSQDHTDVDYVDKLTAEDFTTDNALTLYAQWKIKTFKLTLNINSNTTLEVTVKIDTETTTYNSSKKIDIPYGAIVTVTKGAANSGYNSFAVSSTPTGLVTQVGSKFTMTQDVTISTSAQKDSSCIVEGTLVTLADGTQKKVEDLQLTDLVLSFNHTTGQFETKPLNFIAHMNENATMRRVINLQFSDGSVLGVVVKHGLFDLTVNKYVFITEENMNEFVGHGFSKINTDNSGYYTVTLVRAFVTEKVVKVFSPTSQGNINIITEGLLTLSNIPFGAEELLNMFEFGDGMKYDETKMIEDIEKYGVYSYEDFAEYMTYEEFVNSPVAYLKVGVGKGLISYEQIIQLLEYQKRYME